MSNSWVVSQQCQQSWRDVAKPYSGMAGETTACELLPCGPEQEPEYASSACFEPAATWIDRRRYISIAGDALAGDITACEVYDDITVTKSCCNG